MIYKVIKIPGLHKQAGIVIAIRESCLPIKGKPYFLPNSTLFS